ncbi:MAG TPA: hypothetical protein VGO62_10875, partial [Myxococcota bacterium]
MRSFVFASMCLGFVASSLGAAEARAQNNPAAGTITAVPATARLDVDGDGTPDTATLTQSFGFCGFFAKSSGGGFPNNQTDALQLLDNTASPTVRFTPDPAFHDLVEFADVDDKTTISQMTPSGASITDPWTSSSAVTCTSQHATAGGGTITQFDAAAFRLRGNIAITTAGTKTFVVNSDDGYTLTIGGLVVTQFNADRSPGSDSRRVSFAQPGIYPIEVVFWEQGGLATLEVAYADDERTFGGNSSGSGAVQAGAGGHDRTNQAALTSLPAGFVILGTPRVGPATWNGSDAASTCADRIGQPNQICVANSATALCGNSVIDQFST